MSHRSKPGGFIELCSAADGWSDTKHVPCKFFQRGSCQSGVECTFSHSLEATNDAVCLFFAKGDCKFGEKCVLSHNLGGPRDTGTGDINMTDVTIETLSTATDRCDLGEVEIANPQADEQSVKSPTKLAKEAAVTTPVSKAVKNSPAKTPVSADIRFPYNLRPKWAIERNRPVFDDEQELSERFWSMSGNAQGALHKLFWQHPVRYMPDVTDKNLYRTIMIDFLPLNTTLKDVLGLIRGGALESIQLFPPIGNVTDFKTARVVFHYEIPAVDMQMYWFQNQHSIRVHGQAIRVLLCNEPTYPKNRQLDEDVFMHYYTRILLIDNVKDSVVRLLPSMLERQIKMGFLVDMGVTEDGILMVEFTSVVEAVKAMKRLQVEEAFHGAVFDFEDDYSQEGSY